MPTAGAGSGLVASVATCPLDVIKTKLQAQQVRYNDKAYLGVFGAPQNNEPPIYLQFSFTSGTAKHIVVSDGLRGLYRGLGPTILGYLPTWAIYFSVYDGIKTYFGEQPLAATPRSAKKPQIYPAPQAKGYQPTVREHPWALHILSAMCAGASSTIVTNPLWVIKTRFQVSCIELGRHQRYVIDVTFRLDSASFGGAISAHIRCYSYYLQERRVISLL